MDPAESDERQAVLFGVDGELVERVARVGRALLLRDQHVRQLEPVVRLRATATATHCTSYLTTTYSKRLRVE